MNKPLCTYTEITAGFEGHPECDVAVETKRSEPDDTFPDHTFPSHSLAAVQTESYAHAARVLYENRNRIYLFVQHNRIIIIAIT